MALVLVVDDELHVRLLLAELLRSLNHDVRLAPTAAEGVELFRNDHPDAVVVDIRLPDASGMTVLDAIYETRPDVPVIMMSGHADDGVAQDSRKRGAFDFLVKPFSIDAFVRIIAAALA